MPEIMHQASDDQIALAICIGAVMVSGLIMHFSMHIGRLTGRIPHSQSPQHREFRLREASGGHPAMAAESASHGRAA